MHRPLKLLQQYENQFAILDGGHGLTIGLLTDRIHEAVKALKGRGITEMNYELKNEALGVR